MKSNKEEMTQERLLAYLEPTFAYLATLDRWEQRREIEEGLSIFCGHTDSSTRSVQVTIQYHTLAKRWLIEATISAVCSPTQQQELMEAALKSTGEYSLFKYEFINHQVVVRLSY